MDHEASPHNMCNGEHDERIARVAFAKIEPGSPTTPAANHQPPPSPGYRSAGPSLFYVTPRGRTWLVRVDATVQLTPAEIPDDCVVVDDDEVHDLQVIALAETADSIESEPPGIYTSNGLNYVATHRLVRMLYGDEHRPVVLADLPPDAVKIDLVPEHVLAVASQIQEAG